METKKLKNAQNLLRLSYGFNNFLNHEFLVQRNTSTTYQLNGNGTKEEYKNILITHAVLMLSVFKEKLLNKDEEENLKLRIADEAFNTLMGNLIQADGTKYKIGDLPFDEKIEVLEILRNKLLHGDYYIDGETIILNNNGITGTIKIDDLVRMCVYLLATSNFKLHGPNVRPMVMSSKDNVEKDNRLQSLNQLRTYLSKAYYYRFIDLPEPGYERTVEYANTLTRFFEELTSDKQENEGLTIEEIFEKTKTKFAEQLKKHHITINLESTPIPETDCYNRIETLFQKNKKQFFNKMSPLERRQYMLQAAMSVLIEKDDDELVIANAIYNNMKILYAYIHNKNLYRVGLNQQQSITYLDDMTVAGLFNAFYCIYHYGLDEIYSNQGNTSLKGIANGEFLNFARLQLDLYDDDHMTYDVSFADFPNQLLALEKKVKEAEARYELAKTQLDGYYKSATKKSDKAEQNIMDMIESCKDKYEKTKKTYEEAKRFMTKDYHKYVRNFNIIAHMRNSFAHGNVRIKPFIKGDTLKDQTITMKDIYQGALTYYLHIRYEDLYQLVMSPNIDIMREFISNRIEAIEEKKKEKEKSSTLKKK